MKRRFGLGQQGFSPFEFIIILFVLCVMGGIGYYYLSSNAHKATDQTKGLDSNDDGTNPSLTAPVPHANSSTNTIQNAYQQNY
jgi:hypothetical protein